MTQMELADLMGVSYQAVSNWERGNSMPDISKLGDLAAALHVSIDTLIGNDSSVQLAKHVLSGDETDFIRDEKVAFDDLAEIAPLLKPTQTHRLFDTIAKKRQEPVTLAEFALLAPFLDSSFLDSFIKNIDISDLSEIMEIAPFVSQTALDELAKKVLPGGSVRDLANIAPFVSGEVLAAIVRDDLNDAPVADWLPLAPFLPKEAMHEIAEKMIREKGLNAVTPISPFL